MKVKLAAIVFDLDDTLYPERSYVLGGFAAVARHLHQTRGLNPEGLYAELAQLYEAGVRRDTFDRLCRKHSVLGADAVAELIEVYRHHRPEIALHDDARLFLDRFREEVALGMVTDGWLPSQTRKVEALGIAPYFRAIVYSDALGREYWKPSRRPYEVCLDRLNLRPEEALYVGDNPHKDFTGALGLGMRCVRVVRPDGEYTRLPGPPGVLQVTNLAELEPLVLEWMHSKE